MADDVNDILRRLIAGNMAQGGPDYAAKLMARGMGTPEQIRAAEHQALVAAAVARGAKQDHMMATEPDMAGIDPAFQSVNPSYMEIQPPRFADYPDPAEMPPPQSIIPPAQAGLPTGGLPPNPQSLSGYEARRNSMPPKEAPDNRPVSERIASAMQPVREGAGPALNEAGRAIDWAAGLPKAAAQTIGAGAMATGGAGMSALGYPDAGQSMLDSAARLGEGASRTFEQGLTEDSLETRIQRLQMRLEVNPADRQAAEELTALMQQRMATESAAPAPGAPQGLRFGGVPSMGGEPIGTPMQFSGPPPVTPPVTPALSSPAPSAGISSGAPAPGAAPMAGLAPTTGGAAGPSGTTARGMGGLDSLPPPSAVAASNPEAYNPETGTRPDEARALSIWDRMFGEKGSDKRTATSQALMQMGAVMMSAEGNFGQALGMGIQAGILEYDQTLQALADEAREAKKAGMEEEAMAMELEMKRLALARAKSGGTGGGRRSGPARQSGVVQNPLDAYREKALLLEAAGYPLSPAQLSAGAAEAIGLDLPASAYSTPKANEFDALLGQ
jgi:hypothetical protein